MSRRRNRQGILGLFLLITAALTIGAVLWLKGNTFGQSTFEITATFPDATGINEGSVVRFRGSAIGQVTKITPKSEGIELRIRINEPTLSIPANSLFAINQSSFLGSSTLDITPPETAIASATKPLDRNCDRGIILCNNSAVRGQQGVSTEALLRASMDFTKAYSDPAFVQNLVNLTKSANLTALELSKTSKEYALLAQTARQELRQLSAVSTTTAQAFTRTSDTANVTLSDISALLTENRSTLVSTLDNLSQTAQGLKVTIAKVGPSIDRFTSGPILQNLEVLSNNAAITSANLRDASKALNDPTTLMQLQQTLDAARVTFQNTQKLTTDVDDLIGDPKLRENLRQLINGLSNLVSDANQLQRQTQFARETVPGSNPLVQNPAGQNLSGSDLPVQNLPVQNLPVQNSPVQNSSLVNRSAQVIPAPGPSPSP